MLDIFFYCEMFQPFLGHIHTVWIWKDQSIIFKCFKSLAARRVPPISSSTKMHRSSASVFSLAQVSSNSRPVLDLHMMRSDQQTTTSTSGRPMTSSSRGAIPSYPVKNRRDNSIPPINAGQEVSWTDLSPRPHLDTGSLATWCWIERSESVLMGRSSGH